MASIPHILTINGGSSSIKFALYEQTPTLTRGLHGKIDRIDLSGTKLTLSNSNRHPSAEQTITASDHAGAIQVLIQRLKEEKIGGSITAIGHRVVHGMQHTEPERVTDDLLAELDRLVPCAPEHLPSEIEPIKVFRQQHPHLPQVVCFDTAFGRTMPRVAKLLPIPSRLDAKRFQRWGFHGPSLASNWIRTEMRRARRSFRLTVVESRCVSLAPMKNS